MSRWRKALKDALEGSKYAVKDKSLKRVKKPIDGVSITYGKSKGSRSVKPRRRSGFFLKNDGFLNNDVNLIDEEKKILKKEEVFFGLEKEEINFEEENFVIKISNETSLNLSLYPKIKKNILKFDRELYLLEQLSIDEVDAEEHEVVIGFDFGTSSIKIVIGDLSLSKSFAVNFRQTEGIDSYLLPSRLYENKLSNEYSDSFFSLEEDTDVLEIYRDLKLSFMANHECKETQIRIVALFCLVIRHTRAWLFEKYGSIYKNSYIYWGLNIGFPVAFLEGNEIVVVIDKLIKIAWLLANNEESVIKRSSVVNALNENVEQIDVEVNVYPEIAAQIYGFVKSDYFDVKEVNRYLLVDVGAGTVDSSLFRVFKEKGKWSFEFYTKNIEPYGVANLHSHRLEWWSKELQKIKGSSFLINEIDKQKFSTEFENDLPPTFRDYFSKIIINKEIENNPDEVLYKKIWKQVVGDTFRSTVMNRLLNESDLTDMPMILCGGGARMLFYKRLSDEMKNIPGCSWASIVDVRTTAPKGLEAKGVKTNHLDRLSVAYGLANLDLNAIKEVESLPKIPTKKTDFQDRYIDKDMC